MRTHTKTTLHKLVMELTQPGQPAMQEEEIAQWMERLPAISNDQSHVMRMMLFGAMSNSRVRRYLGQIHRECTFLLDVLYKHPEFPDRLMPLYQGLLGCLSQIMEVLHRSYVKYIDLSEKMPMLQYREAAAKIEAQVGPLVSAMCTYNTEKNLQALIVGKMTGLLKNETGSWQQISYLEKLQTWVLDLCKGKPFNMTSELKMLLLRANFNTTGFIAYCKAGIAQEMAEHFDMPGKYDCLFAFKKELAPMTYKHHAVKFEAGRPGTKQILLSYINAELTCMDSKQDFSKPSVVTTVPEAAFRLPVAISVDILAYFFKLLVKVGVVNGMGKRPLIQFISRSFQTQGIGNANLSVQSIDSKYRQVLSSTAISVKSILLKMLKQLDDEF